MLVPAGKGAPDTVLLPVLAGAVPHLVLTALWL